MSCETNRSTEAEELLARLEAARARLEATDDPEQAIEVLQELVGAREGDRGRAPAGAAAAETDAAGA